MAACTELELEEKSSEKGSHSVGNVSNSSFYNAPSKARCNVSRNVNGESDSDPQIFLESETGDLIDLSDDVFRNLLEEASTFNKPNNEESILLKQLRKEVGDNDSCENVGRNEVGRVSKRVDRKCSKLPYASSSTEPLVTSNTSSVKSIQTTLPARTFQKTSTRKSEKVKDSTPVLLSFTERNCAKRPPITHHIVEIETNNNQWTLKPVKPLDSSLAQLLNVCSENDDNYSLKGYQERLVDANDTNSLQKHNGGSINMVKLDEDASTLVADIHDIPNDQCNNNDCMTDDPQDIELMELKRKDTKDQDLAEKRSNGSELSNSKFYVNCGNDVDATVTFPLKFVSAPVDERNSTGLLCDAMNDQSKRLVNFPCFSWPRAQQVHSFLGSLPVDHDALQAQNDADGMGNPFARGAYATNVASFMSATFVDYQSTALMSDSQSKYDMNHRKYKRTRNNAENRAFILAENIAGHRGNEDIDSLVQYIEAADKNNKALNRTNHSNQILKNIPTQELLKRRVSGRDTKSNQNSKGSGNLKKRTDEAPSTSKPKNFNLCEHKTLSSESELSDDSVCNNANKMATAMGSDITTQCLDINSNVMDTSTSGVESLTATSNSTSDESALLSCETLTSTEMSSFSADFYAISETLPQQPVEESGFRIVKKKQRKRHQGKRSENYRWHSAAARVRQSTSGNTNYYDKEQVEHDSSMMLLSNIQRNQCSKQDSRRKSTSSVPHSDQSSVDNSDLDSVHSLPVRGSAPHPTKMHPHTTPSSSSSTPQASYADIARMPVSSAAKVNSVPTGTTPVSSKSVVDDIDQPEQVAPDADNSDEFPAKESDLCDPDICEMTNIMPSAKLTREINTQTEPLSEVPPQPHEDTNTASSNKSGTLPSISGDGKNSHCLANCSSKHCACSKMDKMLPSKPDNDRIERPAVVMMGNIPFMEASDISFGVDLAEILQMSSSDSTDLNDSGVASHSPTSDTASSEKQACCEGECCSSFPALSSSSKSSFDDCSIDKCDASDSDNNLLKSTVPSSPPYNELRLASGRRLLFADDKVDSHRYNMTQIIDYVSREWKNVQKEFANDTNKNGDKVKYYRDTC